MCRQGFCTSEESKNTSKHTPFGRETWCWMLWIPINLVNYNFLYHGIAAPEQEVSMA